MHVGMYTGGRGTCGTEAVAKRTVNSYLVANSKGCGDGKPTPLTGPVKNCLLWVCNIVHMIIISL